MTDRSDTPASFPDPFAAWREWLTRSEREWNKVLNDAMGSDQFQAAMGNLTSMYVSMQQSINDASERYFKTINVPTRNDLLEMGQRLDIMESRLESIEGLLRRIVEPQPPGAAARRKPKRTRKPPKRQQAKESKGKGS